MSDKAREAAAGAMTVALKNAADQVYWWDEADRQIIGGGEPEWTEYTSSIKLADRFDMQAIANAAIDAYIAALAETHAIVPREPTEAIVKAMCKSLGPALAALARGDDAPPDDAPGPHELYRAMLNAAEGE